MRKILAKFQWQILAGTMWLFCGCGVFKEKINEVKQSVMAIQDPTERGLVWIAIAIVVSAVIRAHFNK